MLTRREWLLATGSLLLTRFEVGCGSDDAASPGGGVGSGDFDRWSALRKALVESPDHLRARADAAVESKDPKRIFEFVRDNIATVPPLGQGESLAKAVRFGVENLLRSGAGTPRERAELLMELLQRAGFAASVVQGSVDGPLFENDAPQKVYLRRISLPFEPGAPPGGGSWSKTAPPAASEVGVLDADGVESSALFEKLRPLVTPTATVNPPFIGVLSPVPLVALERSGKTEYLNPLLADAEFGQSYATSIVAAEPAAEPSTVVVRLSATRKSAPAKPIVLAEGSFGFDELAGSRLRISPQPFVDLPSFLAAKPLDVTSFATGFALIGSDGMPRRFVRGATIGASGDVVGDSGGEPLLNGVPQLQGGKAASVAKASASAASVSPPMVEVLVAPTDAGGAVVTGIPASEFVLEEDGVRVGAALRENGGAPRVLVLWDCTGSQPLMSDAIAQGLADAIFAGAPAARVQVRAADGGVSPDGFTLATPGEVKAALLGVSGVASPIYAALLEALSSAAPTLIVLCTDGDVELSPALASQCLAALASCPVMVVGCALTSTAVKTDVLGAIAAASGGALVNAGDFSDMTATKAKLTELGAARSARPYRLVYASKGKPGKHTLDVTVGKASASAEFSLGEAQDGGNWSDFVGMHLHVEMGGETVERTLAGLEAAPLPDAEDASVRIAAATREVRDFLLSSTWIGFEGGAPTLSAWYDDLLSATIGFRPVAEAVEKKDAEAAYAAAALAPMRPLARSLLAHAPLPQPAAASGALVREYGLRAVLHRTFPLSGRYAIDILPTLRFRCIGVDDGGIAFDHAMRASLRLAVAEAAIAQGSTLAYLATAPLQGFPPGGISESDLTGFPAAERKAMAALLGRYSGSHRIIAKDGSTQAFWAIDGATGTALGVLTDASGGAIEECKQLVEVIETLMDQLSIVVAAMDAGLANAFIVISAVGKAAAISVGEAALSFTDPLINPSIWQLGQTIACSALGDLVGDKIPGQLDNVLAPALAWLKNATGGAVAGLVPGCTPVAVCSPKAP